MIVELDYKAYVRENGKLNRVWCQIYHMIDTKTLQTVAFTFKAIDKTKKVKVKK